MALTNVSMWTDKGSVMDEILRAALTYMYNYLHDEEKSLNANTCYLGYGRTVSQDRIIDIIAL